MSYFLIINSLHQLTVKCKLDTFEKSRGHCFLKSLKDTLRKISFGNSCLNRLKKINKSLN